MASITHRFRSTKADASDSSLVKPSDWNDDHDITLSQRAILGRLLASEGSATEILIGLDGDDQVPTRSDIKIHYGMRSIVEFGVDTTGAEDSADALDDMIAQINAGTLKGGIMVPPDAEIVVSRPLAPIQQGGWIIGCVLGNTASFVLQRDDATSYGRIFQIGVAAVSRVSGWGFQNITIDNQNWRTDTGAQWGIEVVYAAQGILWNVDFQNCGWKHGSGTSNGGKCTWHNVSFTLNKALPQGGIHYAYASGITVYDGNATAVRRNMCDDDTDVTVSNAGVASTVLVNFMPLLAGWTYKVEFTVSGYSAGSVTPRLTGGGTVSGAAITANGDYKVSLVAAAGNNCFSFAASSTAQMTISSLKVSRAAHADFRAMKLGPEMVGGNIDSLDFHGFKCNVPQDTDVPYSLEIDASFDDIGSVLFDTCYFELAVEGAILIHSRNAATGFVKGLIFKDCRASPQKNKNVSAIHVDNVNNVPIRFDWTGGQINGAKNASSVLISATSPSAPHAISFNGAICQDRASALGSAHSFFEVKTGGTRIINCALSVDFDNDTLAEYACMIDIFAEFTADVPDAVVVNNQCTKATAAEVIDVSAVTTLYSSTAKFSIYGNLGTTKHILVPLGTSLPCDGGAIGNGTVDDTAKMQSVLAAGKTLILDRYKTYKTTRRISITVDGTGVEGNDANVIMSTAAGHFDNTDYASRFNDDANFIVAEGSEGDYLEGVFVRDVRIVTSARLDPSILCAIRMEYCRNIDISGNEVSGWASGAMITLNDIDGGYVEKNHLHDAVSNVTAASSSAQQVTGISVDSDCTIGSKMLHIRRNRIENLTVGATPFPVRGYQSDGINIAGTQNSNPASHKPTTRCLIEGNIIYNVGEGIDCFGSDNSILNNVIERAFGGGIKMIHSASRNRVAGNHITESGYAGILMGGSTSGTNMDAVDNVIENNTIINVNRPIDWVAADGVNFFTTSGSTTYWKNVYNGGAGTTIAGIRIDTPTGDSKVDRTIIRNNQLLLGGNADNGIFIESNIGYAQTTQYVSDNHITGYLLKKYQDNGDRLDIAKQLVARIALKANHTLDSVITAQPLFNVPSDTAQFNAEANTPYFWRMGNVRIISMSGSSGDFSFGIGGTAGISFAPATVDARKVAAGTRGSWETTNFDSAAALAVVTANTVTSGVMRGEGFILTTTAGTLVWQITLSVAAAAQVRAGSWLEIWEDWTTSGAVGNIT